MFVVRLIRNDGLDDHNRNVILGGFDGLSSLDTVERFDPEENKWSMVSKMLMIILLIMITM